MNEIYIEKLVKISKCGLSKIFLGVMTNEIIWWDYIATKLQIENIYYNNINIYYELKDIYYYIEIIN